MVDKRATLPWWFVKASMKRRHDELEEEEGNDDVDEYDEEYYPTEQKLAPGERRKCPYLDTVNRQVLDFDMEKLCSVTLSNMNVYSCLVCGKFFQGRGKATPAYTHSVQMGHFVFINLHDCRTFCLPDGYEIIDSSLDDVKSCLSPVFAASEIKALNHNSSLSRDVYGARYLPGFVGLNNLKNTDYVNVILHALSHVAPVRDFFMQPENYTSSKSNLVAKFGDVVRKMWSPHNFKSIVSPQEFLHEVSVASKRKFNIGQQAEAAELLAWLLADLHKGLSGSPSPKKPSVISKSFGGLVEVTTLTKVTPKRAAELAEAVTGDVEVQQGGGSSSVEVDENGDRWERKVSSVPFNYLSLDIPPTPLFRDSEGGLIIPQIPLFEILKKFDGSTWTDQVSVSSHIRRRYRIQKLPDYLIFHLLRFTKNNFLTLEKNRTVVTFPVKNLSLKEYYFPPTEEEKKEEKKEEITKGTTGTAPPKIDRVQQLGIKELKDLVTRWGSEEQRASLRAVIDSEALRELARAACEYASSVQGQLTKYDLVANICHDSDQGNNRVIGVGGVGGTTAPSVSNTASTNLAAVSKAAATAAAGGTTTLQVSNGGPGGSYRVHTQNKATGQWFELQDLHVVETTPQQIGISEAYVLIYERKTISSKDAYHHTNAQHTSTTATTNTTARKQQPIKP